MSVFLFCKQGRAGEVVFAVDEALEPKESSLAHLFSTATWCSPPTKLRGLWGPYSTLIIATDEPLAPPGHALPRPIEFYNSMLLKSAIQKVEQLPLPRRLRGMPSRIDSRRFLRFFHRFSTP